MNGERTKKKGRKKNERKHIRFPASKTENKVHTLICNHKSHVSHYVQHIIPSWQKSSANLSTTIILREISSGTDDAILCSKKRRPTQKRIRVSELAAAKLTRVCLL